MNPNSQMRFQTGVSTPFRATPAQGLKQPSSFTSDPSILDPKYYPTPLTTDTFRASGSTTADVAAKASSSLQGASLLGDVESAGKSSLKPQNPLMKVAKTILEHSGALLAAPLGGLGVASIVAQNPGAEALAASAVVIGTGLVVGTSLKADKILQPGMSA
jgi:hypothetical protein